jgi:ribosomal protein L6P/L9E
MKYTLNYINLNFLSLYKSNKLNRNLVFNVKLNLGSFFYNNNIIKLILIKNSFNKYFFKTRYLKPLFTILKNIIISINNGFYIELVLIGLGFKVTRYSIKHILKFELHFSHNLIYKIPHDVCIKTGKRKLLIFGINKQRVIDTAYEIRSLRIPNIYKGKGIKFLNEIIKLKPGKQR